MGFYDNRVCALCGGAIEPFGSRKLADGRMCSRCAAKAGSALLSRGELTAAELRELLSRRAKHSKENRRSM